MTTLGSASRGLDQTRDTLLSTIWTTVEANTGIICACLPMLRTPLSRVFPRIFLRSSSDHHSPRSPYGLSTGFPARRRLGGSNSLSCGMGGNTRFSGTRIPDGMQQTPYIPKAPAKSSTASSEPITSIPLGAISKTTEVAVSFEDRESGLSSSHEQHEQRLVV